MNQLNNILLSLANFDATLFHFMRPQMLWALPALLVFWLLLRRTAGSHRWEQYIPKELVAALQTDTSERTGLWRTLILVIWALLVVSAAGPSWQKQTAPVVENQRAVIIVLDLSPSMMAQDLKPDRLTRAKYKLIDIIRGIADGHTGLVAYAGDAHTVSPLSDDPKTLEALLPALSPSIMPSSGSNVEAGVRLAIQLLKDAGAPSGEIILITDGVSETALDSVRDMVSGQIKRLSILGVGTATAAPIPQSRGGFLRDSQGEIILSKINSAELSSLAQSLGGAFVQVSADGRDVSKLIADDFATASTASTDIENPLDISQLESSLSYDSWVDMGPILALLLLPFVLLLFRRGLVYLVPLAILLPQPVEAADFVWKDLWQTKDQQAANQFQSEQYDAAAKTFDNSSWRAAAQYRNKNYQQTIAELEGKTDIQSLYNRANALALNGDLERALDAYAEVLEIQPDHEDAAFNKQLLEQASEQQQDQQSDSDSDEQNGDDQQSEGDEPDKGQNSEAGNQDESSSNESEKSEQEGDQEKDSEQGDDESEQDPQDAEGKADSEGEQETDSDQSQDNEGDASEPENEQPEDREGDETEQVGATQEGPEPLDDASEQWLRAIQDDPGGLLRRKFKYQSEQRRLAPTKNSAEQEQRY